MIQKAEKFVQDLMAQDASGHDWFHTQRVLKLARTIARQECLVQKLDLQTVELIALLHDVDDRKLSPDTWKDLGRANTFLMENGVDEAGREFILAGIRQISYKGKDSVAPDSIEAKCVQDADRLDAIGAIGIARAFAFGGSRGRAMYDPEEPPVTDMDAETYANSKGHTINHFYEKLLLLKNLMNTETGRKLAQQRHAFMETFLRQFYDEWDGLA